MRNLKFLYSIIAVLVTACSLTNDSPQVIYITATPQPLQPEVSPISTTVPPNIEQQFQPTADPPRTTWIESGRPQQHTIQTGDTLYGIALSYGISLDSLVEVNAQLTDPNTLIVGQAINLPGIPEEKTPDFKILPDSRLVRGPGSSAFDIPGFIAQQPGFIRTATDAVNQRLADGSVVPETLNAAQIIERVALEYSVDARLLLALLEYRANWLSNPEPPEDLQTNPMISPADSEAVDRTGLYRQLIWAANQLNWGYYGWKYRGWTTLEFDDGPRLLYNPGLNAASVGLQYFFSLNTPYEIWLQQVQPSGFYQIYNRYFNDPFAGSIDPIVPPGIQQPPLTLPFASGETWFYTGGWHGGWNNGSAWSAIDFAPPDDPSDTQGLACYTSAYWVRAVAPGVIARSDQGAVVLDLDGDGDESTGWTVFYLHIATQDRISVGTQVNTGDPIGRAACEGGFSTATHLHIARRYNGEWLPADCSQCSELDRRPAFNLGGWQVIGIINQEYQGYLEKDGQRLQAEQGRQNPNNRVSW